MKLKLGKAASLALAFAVGMGSAVVAEDRLGSSGTAAPAPTEKIVTETVEVPVEKIVTETVRVHEIPEECHRALGYAVDLAEINQGFQQWSGTVRRIMDDVQWIAGGTKFKDALLLKGDVTQLERDFGGVFNESAELRFVMEQNLEACEAKLE